ncbi:HDIG domain-containing protein [bacterium]|nr:HDIG domain-containing protein [bacterium]
MLVAVLTTLLVFLLLMARLRPEQVSYQVGDTATHTIKANRATAYTDDQATQQLRDEAAAAVPMQYTRDADAPARAVETVHDIFLQTRDVRNDPNLTDRMTALRDHLDIQLSDASRGLLLEATPRALQRVEGLAADEVRQAMERPIHGTGEELSKAQTALAERAKTLGLSQSYQRLLVEIEQLALQPNWVYNPETTAAKRAEAERSVAEVRRQLQPGDIVIARDEKVTERHMAMFTALGLMQPSVDILQALSLLGVLVLLMAATMLFIRRFANEVWADDQLFLVICVTLIVVAGLFGLSRGMTWFEAFGISVVSAAGIFLSLAARPIAGSACAIFLGSLVSLASPISEAHLLLTATLAALLASHYVRARESRSSTIARAAILTAVTNVLLTLLNAYVFGFLVSGKELGFIGVGGFLAAIVAAGVISGIERPLGLTTSLRLLELQNPNEPLLKRLLTEAPGSYQSSVMVANIAEPAAAAVGADPILTRTACMYHDIGKLKRSYFFVENQFGAENPHERLSPHLSALVLMSHVKEGQELAAEMRLPPIVGSVIAQHHGTSLVSFMYQRAQAEATNGEQVRESDYRYPGPKPQTKENAIIMLADTVEAAARTLEEPTRPRIEALVDRLVEARIADGQLDESPLTFKDITIVKESFVNTLAGMFHQRLAYPSEAPRHATPAPAPEPESEPEEAERVRIAD